MADKMIDELALTTEEMAKVVSEASSPLVSGFILHDFPEEARAISLATVKKVVGWLEKTGKRWEQPTSSNPRAGGVYIAEKDLQEIKKALEEG